MSTELAASVSELAARLLSGFRCLGEGCARETTWRLFPDEVNALDLITAVGAIGSLLAVVGAAIAILQATKARNLSTVIELTRQLSAEREKAHAAGIYGMENHEFHAYQMVHLIEQASMIVNEGWVTGRSKEFLLDWLRLEIPSMADQPAYRVNFDSATGQQLSELFKLRDQFERERKQEAHFERIHDASKVKRIQ